MRHILLALALVTPFVAVSAQNSRRVGDMSVARNGAAAAPLPDGRVLVTGGGGGSSTWDTAEVYDPSTTRFTATGSMRSTRTGHTATRLLDGRILIAGGRDRQVVSAAQVVPFSEIYDPATGRFSDGSTMIQPRYEHTATLLSDGKVLIVGGNAPPVFNSIALAGTSLVFVNSAEAYNPSSDAFEYVAAISVGRHSHSGTLLPTGAAVIAGGITETDRRGVVVDSIEAFDPARGEFRDVGKLAVPRWRHIAVPLSTGGVLFLGGGINLGGTATATAEVWRADVTRRRIVR